MRRWALICIVALLTVASTACGGTSGGGDIVVTTNILGDVVRNVVGDSAAVRVLMKPNADPHSFGVSAQEAAAMSSAGVIIYNGLGLEENVIRMWKAVLNRGFRHLPSVITSIPFATRKATAWVFRTRTSGPTHNG